LKIIGQLHGTYLLCESHEGLVLVDQHAAHERIRFEQLKALAGGSTGRVQTLMVPETLDLSFSESEVLESLLPELSRLGFDIEPFGGNTFAVKAVPAVLSDREVRPLLMELIETAAETGVAAKPAGMTEPCLIVMACHGTVRANQPLTESEMRALLAQLDGCENAAHCPHGRPIWIQWSRRDLEKSFGRIV